MTSQLESQQSELVEANRQLDQRRRFTEAVLAGVSAGVHRPRQAGPHQSAEPLGLGPAGRRSRAASWARLWPKSCPRWRRLIDEAAVRVPNAWRRRRSSILSRGPRQRPAWSASRPSASEGEARGYRRHLRRHHRAAVGPAQGRLGRRRPPHRPRDQEPADPDPALGRAAQAEISEAKSQTDPGDLHHLHRHHHPPGRRYRPHGRRVLVLRAHAGAGDEAGGPRRDRAPGGVPAAHRDPGDPLRRSRSRTSRSSISCDSRQISQALINLLQERRRIDRDAPVAEAGGGRAGDDRADPRAAEDPRRP